MSHVDKAWTVRGGEKLTDVLSEEDAVRYDAVGDRLKQIGTGGSAVLYGHEAVVAYRDGDTLKAASYGARSTRAALSLSYQLDFVQKETTKDARAGLAVAAYALDAYRYYQSGDELKALGRAAKSADGLVDLAEYRGRVGNGSAKRIGTGLSLLGDGVEVYDALKDGDNARAAVYTARGMASLIDNFYDDHSIGPVKVGVGVHVALGVVDVSYSLYKASKEDDPIRKQAYVESAAATAVDVGIALIPTVGPAIEAAWGLGWTAAIIVRPELAKQRMYRSPGALVVYTAQVFFTRQIPSAIADIAYEQGARALLEAVIELERSGQPAVAILPRGA